jgi:hypothetical protein
LRDRTSYSQRIKEIQIDGKCPGEYLEIRDELHETFRMLSADELLDLRTDKAKLSLGLIN